MGNGLDTQISAAILVSVYGACVAAYHCLFVLQLRYLWLLWKYRFTCRQFCLVTGYEMFYAVQILSQN